MPISAQSADGKVHTFDDGTPRSVIDKVMLDYAASYEAKNPSLSNNGANAQAQSLLAKRQPGFWDRAAGLMANYNRGLGIGDEMAAGLYTAAGALSDGLSGQSGPNIGDRFNASMAKQRGFEDRYSAVHPKLASLAQGTGNATLAAAPLLAAPLMVGGGAILGETLLSNALRGLVTGGLGGSLFGAADRGNLQQRTKSAVNGAYTGAALGAAVPIGIAGVRAVIDKAIVPAARGTMRLANKGIEAMNGGEGFLDPSTQARQRLTEAMGKDDITPQEFANRVNEWRRVGGTEPTILDIVSQNGGGQNTQALMRGAAMVDPKARNIIHEYNDMTAGAVGDNALARTRALTADQRPFQEVQDQFETQHRALANREYQGPYALPIDPTPILPALSGVTGHTALKAAAKEADALKLNSSIAARIPQLDELTNAIHGKPSSDLPLDLGNQDLGTLDRIKIALFKMGKAELAKPQPDIGLAEGYQQHARMIDDHLAAQSSDYRIARDNYANRAGAIDVMGAGKRGLTAAPDQFSLDIVSHPEMARVGYRQALTDAIGAPGEGATGKIKTIATSPNQRRNLPAAFGQGAADDYQSAMRNMYKQVESARRIDPNAGSSSGLNLIAAGDEASKAPPMSRSELFKVMADKLRSGNPLTSQERVALMKFATGKAEPGFMTSGDKVFKGLQLR